MAAGLGAGFVSGLAGVGGGIVMTPILHYVLGYDWTTSIAVSLFAIAIQAPIGIYRHYGKGNVDWRLGLVMAVGGAPGVLLGSWIETRSPVAALKALFAVAMVVTAWQLVQRRSEPPAGTRPGIWVALLVGVVAGVMSRLLGIGGGLVTVPVLALAGVPVHIAIGSSLVPVWTNAVVATVGNIGRDLPWLGGLVMATAALAGAWVGVEAAHRAPAVLLRRLFAVTLVALAVAIAVGLASP